MKQEEIVGDLTTIKYLIEERGFTDAVLYMILHLPECPIALPRARSMTQARLDLEHLKPGIIKWYNTQTPNQ